MDQAKVKIKNKKNLNHLRMIGYLYVLMEQAKVKK